jgi:hypothetical protein
MEEPILNGDKLGLNFEASAADDDDVDDNDDDDFLT